MKIRQVEASDYLTVIDVMNDWWGGRQMADMLPKLFFIHFQETGFIAEEEGELRGFLIGIVSQTYPSEAYIHFVGVHPLYRKLGLAHQMYEQFFQTVLRKGCRTVRCVTSPVNQASIAFHNRMGFTIESVTDVGNGIPVVRNYDGSGNDRVLFVKELK